MGNLNYIVFGGVDSRDYGIYISGEGVFNAPERDVEVVNIPGKDGDLLIDRGRFLNIQVTYPGFNFEPDLSTFAERLRAFRAALASQTGYQRLEDSFHPDEFRLASFRSGLDVNPIMYNTASTFDIVFDCKPQRFLKSGEEEITIGEWGETETITGNIVTFEGTDTTAIKSVVAQIVPIQEGTGDPSPQNIRSISGWDSVVVEQCGKNLLPNKTGQAGPGQLILGDDATTIASASGVYLKSGTYMLSVNSTKTSTIYWYDVSSGANVGIGNTLAPRTVTVSADGYYFPFLYNGSGISSSDVSSFQLELNSTATDYSPYHGQSHSISFPSTVYGGTLDVVSGEGKKTMGIVDLGSLTWARYTGTISAFRASLSNTKIYQTDDVPNLVSSQYPIGMNANNQTNVLTRLPDNSMTMHSGYALIFIRDDRFDNASAFKTAMNGVQLCYELAEPTPIYCEPTEITTIDGVNNIWADTGEVSVEIGEDPNILVNPTPFEALPIFEVVGTGSLTVGNITIDITGDSTQDIFIDSDVMESYEDDNGAIISRNDRINLSGTDFPKLGEETRVESNGLTSVKITPRWWTI